MHFLTDVLNILEFLKKSLKETLRSAMAHQLHSLSSDIGVKKKKLEIFRHSFKHYFLSFPCFPFIKQNFFQHLLICIDLFYTCATLQTRM